MKLLKYLLMLTSIMLTCAVNAQHVAVGSKVPSHPRLLWLADSEKELVSQINSDAVWQRIHQSILTACDGMINKPQLEYVKVGRRLLDVSREALQRIFYLSYAYRMTHDQRYKNKAEQEIIAVCSFNDWNPSHYLDVGEMTMAVAIGYDWLYRDLKESTRLLAKKAILEKGIQTSLDPSNNSWLRVNNNWNQVCNAGITFGAMATYEDHPELSLQIINRAITSVDLPMRAYDPDGAYPEGYGYWEYGTSFNVMLISALATAFGKDFGLSEKPGFLKTAGYLEHMTGAKGMPFNYSDSGTGADFNPAMFWFANKLNDPSLLWSQKEYISTRSATHNRLLPATLIWGRGVLLTKINKPSTTMWTGGGVNPVAMMRSAWGDPNAIFVGVKGGSPAVNHGHMDAGSFVMEAYGVRWGIDFGMQSYESLESKKIDLWNNKQNSQRWQILRYNNFNHNTLTISNGLQNVKGSAPIVSSSATPNFMSAVLDLSSIYAGKVVTARRGVAIVDKQYVLVTDELQSAADSITVRWSMVTRAAPTITGKNTAILVKDGKRLLIEANADYPLEMKIWSTEPKADFDAPNPGTAIIGLEVKIPANTKCSLNVVLIPQGSEKVKAKHKPLAKWPVDNK
jgi:hypothetical protein